MGISEKQIKNIFRVGLVSSVNGETCSARVTFPDKDDIDGKDLVSYELPIITIGSNGTLGYWVPEVGTQVLCVFLPNPSRNGLKDGFVLGAFYSEANPPEETNPNVRCLKVPDGSYIRFDGNGNIEIHASQNLILTGARIDLN